MSRNNTFMAVYACDAPDCEAAQMPLCTTLPDGCDPPVVGVPDGWVTYQGKHFCSVLCFAKVCEAALGGLALLPEQVGATVAP